ncbi:MAG: hypothetical protein R8L07_03445 [Alphaproteobacteria bacterium]|nr:hypothetical protein [Alphaproteobacteria bacterium]
MIDYALTRTVEPAAAILPDARIWDHLRVETSGSPAEPEDKALIDVYREAATSVLDGADGILGRALITQTWQMKLPSFPCKLDPIHRDRRIVLPLPPLQSVTSITYFDSAGDEQTLATSVYSVLTRGMEKGAIVPAYGQSWPATRARADAVTVTFVAGYGNSSDDIPAAIRAAALLLIGDLYEGRTETEVGITVQPTGAVQRLLMPHRIPF